MSMEQQRLLQALQRFSDRSKGAELPKGTEEALAGLRTALSAPPPDHGTPGTRAALRVVPGTTGTGEPMEKAARGVDGPSPGQRSAQGVTQAIQEAASQILANAH